MAYTWRWQNLELRYFSPEQFDHPEHMNTDFLRIIDEWRHRCAIPMRVTDDYRTEEELRAIYPKGPLPDSPHRRGTAIDIRPIEVNGRAKLRMVEVAIQMWREGFWPYLGIEIATRHIHVDNDRSHFERGIRPTIYAGISK